MFAVESKNVVGYGPTELPSSSGISAGPCFVSVSGEKIDLYDLTVTGYETVGETYGDVIVQTLTGGGGTDRTFCWYDYVDGDRIVGWFEIVGDDYVPLEPGDVTLEKGEGLWSVTMTSDHSIKSSGEVATAADVVTPLPASSGITIANPTPIAVDLINCYVMGYETVGETYGDVIVQTLTGGGGTDRTFCWYDYVDGDRIVGWFEIVGDDYVPLEANDIVLEPGEGLWSVTMASDHYFCWPKVDL